MLVGFAVDLQLAERIGRGLVEQRQ
jgi:hypothetical protein